MNTRFGHAGLVGDISTTHPRFDLGNKAIKIRLLLITSEELCHHVGCHRLVAIAWLPSPGWLLTAGSPNDAKHLKPKICEFVTYRLKT